MVRARKNARRRVRAPDVGHVRRFVFGAANVTLS